jgi:hypothetical protein
MMVFCSVPFETSPSIILAKPPHVTPPLPSVIGPHRRGILTPRGAPPQAIAIDEDYTAENAPIIDARLARALRNERFQPLHLLVRQPKNWLIINAVSSGP